MLARLLRQPRGFHACMSGPVGSLFNTPQGDMNGRNEYSGFIADTQRRRILQGLFRSGHANEFDTRARAPGLHKVRQKIAVRERISVLPPNVFRRFKSDAFWRDPQLNLRGVRVV